MAEQTPQSVKTGDTPALMQDLSKPSTFQEQVEATRKLLDDSHWCQPNPAKPFIERLAPAPGNLEQPNSETLGRLQKLANGANETTTYNKLSKEIDDASASLTKEEAQVAKSALSHILSSDLASLKELNKKLQNKPEMFAHVYQGLGTVLCRYGVSVSITGESGGLFATIDTPGSPSRTGVIMNTKGDAYGMYWLKFGARKFENAGEIHLKMISNHLIDAKK